MFLVTTLNFTVVLDSLAQSFTNHLDRKNFMGPTIAFIWLQTAVMILFAKEFLPNDMSHVWRDLFKEKKKEETPEERDARRKADREKNLRDMHERLENERQWHHSPTHRTTRRSPWSK